MPGALRRGSGSSMAQEAHSICVMGWALSLNAGPSCSETGAQVGDIKQGLLANVFERWTTSFPVATCAPPSSLATSSAATAAEAMPPSTVARAPTDTAVQHALGAAYGGQRLWYEPSPSDPFDELRSIAQAFVNSARGRWRERASGRERGREGRERDGDFRRNSVNM